MAFLGGPPSRSDAGGSVPTYRHLLSAQAQTVFNPLRVIAHCDIDAAYAQFEQVRLGLPDDVPLICAQWQSIIAVNYPARKYGIKRFNTIDEAKKMCPHLIVQHVATYRNGESEAGYWGEVDPRTHKVSLDPYRRESLKILAIFKEMVPKGEIEKASIDEAFLDLTPMVIDRLLLAHPYLATVPDDAPEGIDSTLPPAPHIDWTKAGNVVPIGGEAPAEGPSGLDGSDGTELSSSQDADGEGIRRSRDTWEDWALCLGAEIMAEVRMEVWKRLHYTCSAGIAHNKALAKLCSSWKKPNNQTVLRTAATPAFLRDMDFTDIRFLGGKLGNAISTEYNAKTVGDMLTVPLEELQKRFGEESIWVYNILRGIDHTEVTPRVATKSMLASKNTRPAVTTPEQGLHWIGVLGGELNVRLRESREVAPGLWPKTLVLSYRTGIEPSRSRQTPFPFTRQLSTDYIVKYAKKLWDEVCQPYHRGNPMKLNNMALSFTGLERMEEGQRGIEGFFSAGPSKTKANSNADADIDADGILSIPPSAEQSSVAAAPGKRSRPSSPKPGRPEHKSEPSAKKTRLPTLHTGKRKTGLESFLVKRGESSSGSGTGTSGQPPNASTLEPIMIEDATRIDAVPAFTTATEPTMEAGPSRHDTPNARTDDLFDPPTFASDSAANGDDDSEAQATGSRWMCPQCNALFAEPDASGRSLSEQKQEHEDYHFALSLQDDGSNGTGRLGRPGWKSVPVLKGQKKVKKKERNKEGIKAFFAPKQGGDPGGVKKESAS